SNALSSTLRLRPEGSLSKGPSPSWFVYVVRCSDGSYYVGHAQNVAYRVNVHNAGDGASWTRRRRPVVLVYQEPVADESSAVQRELQLKGWFKKIYPLNGDRVADVDRSVTFLPLSDARVGAPAN